MQAKFILLSALLAASSLSAQKPPQFSAGDALNFLPGNPRVVALLSQVQDARALIAENFLVALVDLDDDGNKEIVVRGSGSSACPNGDNGACATLVLQQRGKRMTTLASQPMFRELAATREKVGGLRALAFAPDGQIVVGSRKGAPFYQQQIVYTMQAPVSEGAPVEAAASPAMPTTGDPAERRSLPDVLGFKLGMTFPEVRARIAELKLQISHAGAVQLKGLPNSEFRPIVDAGDMGPNGTFFFGFSAPPATSRLTSVHRTMDYQTQTAAAAPAAAALKDALLSKFGKPSAIQPDIGKMVWIWDAKGGLLPRDLGSPCSMLAGRLTPRAAPSASSEQSRKVVDSGCGVYMEVYLTPDAAGVVRKLEHVVIDVAGAEEARRQTEQALAGASRQQNDADLQRATRSKPSI